MAVSTSSRNERLLCTHVPPSSTRTPGTLLFAWRNNIDNVRDIYTLRGPALTTPLRDMVQASHTTWQAFVCPQDGPRLGTLQGDPLITWADPTSGAWTAYVGRSNDDGVTWTEQAAVGLGGLHHYPTLATSDAGVWLALTADGVGTWLFSPDARGFQVQVEAATTGERFDQPHVEARGAAAYAAGVNAWGEAWLRPL